MIRKCANPECSAAFHYFREGRLFQMEFDPEGRLLENPLLGSDWRTLPHHVEYFWLCGDCAAHLTLRYDPEAGVVPEPLPRVGPRAPRAA